MPCVFANLIPEGNTKWELVLLHLHITHIIISLITSDNIRHELDHLVSVLHQEFWQEYPEAFVTPKMHYLLHFDKQLERYGPGRVQWCMGFEGKHAFFTQVKWGNFKDLPKSMAALHQKYMWCQCLSFLQLTICMKAMMRKLVGRLLGMSCDQRSANYFKHTSP